DPETGLVHMNVSRVYESRGEAMYHAINNGERAIWGHAGGRQFATSARQAIKYAQANGLPVTKKIEELARTQGVRLPEPGRPGAGADRGAVPEPALAAAGDREAAAAGLPEPAPRPDQFVEPDLPEQATLLPTDEEIQAAAS